MIPSDEIIWVQIKLENGNEYYITSKKSRELYYVYRLIDGQAEKLGKATSPDILEEKYVLQT